MAKDEAPDPVACGAESYGYPRNDDRAGRPAGNVVPCGEVFVPDLISLVFLSSFSFVILRDVLLCPRFLLLSELFVNPHWTILSPCLPKLAPKMIASDHKSSPTLWQSELIHALTDEWENFDMGLINNLIGSIQLRIQRVI
jgi:hypothetical protein